MKNIPRIEYVKIQNYRALHNLELKKITPLTVFLGPTGNRLLPIKFILFEGKQIYLLNCLTV